MGRAEKIPLLFPRKQKKRREENANNGVGAGEGDGGSKIDSKSFQIVLSQSEYREYVQRMRTRQGK